MPDDSTPLPPGSPFPDATLRSQAGGLRRIAHAILGDEHAAEDAVQDAWVAALQRPPRRSRAGRGVGAWFRQVTRRQALRRRRGEGRREERERVVARSEALGPVDDEVVRREVLREVVDEVLGLPEPYQTAIMLRYFEDLSPRAIAQRTHTTVATVDSRLHRARVLLRERLDARNGGERGAWAPALAAWTGWKGGTAGVPVEPGSTADSDWSPLGSEAVKAAETTMQTKLLLAASIAAALGGGTWLAVQATGTQNDDVDRAARVSLGAEGASDEEVATLGAATDAARVVATRSAEGEHAPPNAVQAHVLTFVGTVFGSEDQPLVGATLWVAQPGHPWNVAATTDRQGSFSVAIVANAPTAELYTFVEHHEVSELGFRVVTLAEGLPDVRYAVRTSGRDRRMDERMVALDRQMAADAEQVDLLSPSEYAASQQRLYDDMSALEVQLSQSVARRPFHPPHESLEVSAAGQRFRWSQLVPGAEDYSRVGRLKVLGYAEVQTEYLEVRDLEQQLRIQEQLRADDLLGLEGEIMDHFETEDATSGVFLEEPIEEIEEEYYEEPDLLRRLVRITGVVRSAQGDPAQGTWVRVSDESLFVRTTRTNADGAYELSIDALGSVQVDAGGGRYGLARDTLPVPRGKEVLVLDWSPQLDRGRELTGRLLGAEGEALSTWTVEFVAFDGGWIDSATVSENGEFALPNLPDVAGRLFARPDGSALVLHVVEGVGAREAHLEIVVPESGRAFGYTTLFVQDAEGEPAARVDSRLVQVGLGRGSWFVGTEGGRLELGCLAGEVRLEAGTSTNGYVDLGSLWIQPDGLHELGTVVLPTLSPPDLPVGDTTEGEARLTRVDLTFPSVIHTGDAARLRALDVPPGTYMLSQ